VSTTDNALYQLSNNFQRLINDLDQALSLNLDLILNAFHVDRAAVFLFDEKESVLRPKKIVTIHGAIEGDGDNFYARRGGSLSAALSRGKEILCNGAPEYCIYLPLITGKRKLGILRIDNSLSRRNLRQSDVPAMKQIADVFGTGLLNSLTHQHFSHQVKKLTTLTQVGTAIGTTLKLREIMELTLSSLVKDLGYDHAQVYLLDEATNTIRENLSIDFRGTFHAVEDIAAISPLITSLLYEPKPLFLSRKFSSNLIAYIPISCKMKKVGLLVVDNLFTRQTLTKYDLSFLGILADQLGTVIENSRLFERVEKMSITDSLTGLYNHRYFYERLSAEISRANRFGNSLALIMLDIDFFKHFNDTYGHQAGDMVLTTVSNIIQSNIRSIDVASRYGGEEIAVILPETDIEGARAIAERIRTNINEHDFKAGLKSNHITVSMGLVCYPVDATLKSELVRKADLALYWVKNNGRNAICAYSRCADL
jgi:diguanylate cyclase (GGDEF)-like protein